jgi:type II restriction enzyme
MADPDIFVWLNENRDPNEVEIARSATIVADRLCGAVADPIIRNAQEKRQLAAIASFLKERGYSEADTGVKFNEMQAGTFAFRRNVPVRLTEDVENTINIPIDVLILPKTAKNGSLPIMIEAKSAGDFTNVNKRRKEEATKMQQLRNTYGQNVSYNLFLCGYFDTGYLGYEAAEGIDWIWEHRISDLEQLGI